MKVFLFQYLVLTKSVSMLNITFCYQDASSGLPRAYLELTLICRDPGFRVQNNELGYQVLDFAAD